MGKKVAILAVNPVNGFGLFQYLEKFFENGVVCKVFAVADTAEIKTNSGITLYADDVVANLRGREDEYDVLVFACGDAMPKFAENANEPYNQDMLAVIKAFGDKGKIMIGHCVAGLMFDIAGVANGKTLSMHPLVKPAVRNVKTTNEKFAVDGNFYTAETEGAIWMIMDRVLEVLT